MKLLPLAAVAVGGLLVATSGTAVAAYALAAQSDVSVTATVMNHPDNGNGTPSQWADDSFVRTMVIHKEATGGYTFKATDKGTFTTRKGAPSPSGAPVKIARTLIGTMTGLSNGTATGTLVSNWKALSGQTFDETPGKQGGAKFPGGGAWANQFFTGGTTTPLVHWSWTYTTADEKWIDADTNNAGKDPSAGNITGKLSSRLAVVSVCHVSKTDGRYRWTVKEVRGDRKVGFTYRVSYRGKWSKVSAGSVNAGGTATITTPTGGFFQARYHDGYGQVLHASARSKPSVYCR